MYKVKNLSFNKSGKVIVLFDTEQKFSLSQSCFVAYPLKKDGTLSELEFQNFLNNYHYFLCKEKAFLFLSYREQSPQELEKKLLQKNFPKKIVLKVLNQLKKEKLIDEERYTKLIIEDYLNSNKLNSVFYLKNKLFKRSISKDTQNKILEEYSSKLKEKEVVLVKDYFYKNLEAIRKEEKEFIKKNFGKLLRKGFPYEILKTSLDELKENLLS